MNNGPDAKYALFQLQTFFEIFFVFVENSLKVLHVRRNARNYGSYNNLDSVL